MSIEILLRIAWTIILVLEIGTMLFSVYEPSTAQVVDPATQPANGFAVGNFVEANQVVNLRASASANSMDLGDLPSGVPVEILRIEAGRAVSGNDIWLYVTTSEGDYYLWSGGVHIVEVPTTSADAPPDGLADLSPRQVQLIGSMDRSSLSAPAIRMLASIDLHTLDDAQTEAFFRTVQGAPEAILLKPQAIYSATFNAIEWQEGDMIYHWRRGMSTSPDREGYFGQAWITGRVGTDQQQLPIVFEADKSAQFAGVLFNDTLNSTSMTMAAFDSYISRRLPNVGAQFGRVVVRSTSPNSMQPSDQYVQDSNTNLFRSYYILGDSLIITCGLTDFHKENPGLDAQQFRRNTAFCMLSVLDDLENGAQTNNVGLFGMTPNDGMEEFFANFSNNIPDPSIRTFRTGDSQR